MPTLSKIRFTNVQYESGNKRYQDELFLFDGHNGAILLENGGGKTVFIQTLIQCVLPNSAMAERKMRDTLYVATAPAHIAVEWILEESPREYAVTCITFFMGKDGLDYYLYSYDYREGNPHAIEQIPFVKELATGKRAASKEEIHEYYDYMDRTYGSAQLFKTRREYLYHLEEQYRIVPTEWDAMLKINSSEGGVDHFFEGCKTMTQLVDKLLIPTAEQGLAVKGAEDFYKLFDNHREHFREYLALGEQLKEYRCIDDQMQQMVQSYREFDEKEREYRKSQGQAKTLLLRMKQESDQIGRQLSALADRKADLEAKEELWEQQREGLRVWTLQVAYEKAEKAVEQQEPNYLLAQETERSAHQRYRTLQYLVFKQDVQDAIDRIKAFEEQLSGLDQELSSEELVQELELCYRQVAYLFAQKLQHLDAEQMSVKDRQKKREELLRANAEQTDQKNQERVDFLNQESTFVERKRNLNEQMVEIESSILFDRQNDRVPQELEKWEADIRGIEQAKIECLEQQKTCDNKKQVVHSQIGNAQKDRDDGQTELNQAQADLASFDRQERALVQEVAEHLPEFSDLQSMHRKEDSIRHRLESQIVLAEKKVEEMLEQERLAFRFYDLYRNSETFSADPELERWVEKVQSDIHSVELGTTFALRVAQSGEQGMELLYEHFPLWPMTVVVAGTDLEKARELLLSLQHQWTHPIYLMTTTQAHAYLLGQWDQATCMIAPGQWKSLTEPHSFQQWLEEQQQSAQDAQKNRQYFVQERQRFVALEGKVRSFFVDYSFEHVTRIRDQKEQAQKKLRDATRMLEDLQFTNDELEEEMQRLKDLWNQLEQRSQDLSQRIKGAKRWQSLSLQRQQVTVELERIKGELQNVERILLDLQSAAALLISEQKQDEQRINELSVEIKTLKNDSLYRRIASKPQEAVDGSFVILHARIDELEGQLKGITHQKHDLERQRDEWEKHKQKAENKFRTHLNDYREGVDQEFTYAGDLEVAVEQEQQVWQQVLAYYQTQKQVYEQLRNDSMDAKRYLEINREKFFDTYGADQSLPVFEGMSIEFIEEKLRLEKDELREQKKRCQNEQVNAKKLLDEIHEVHTKLEVLSQKQGHKFAQPDLPVVPLSDEDEQRFPYARMLFVKGLENRLDLQADRVSKMQENVRNDRKNFQQYLEQVREERIRQQTLDGLLLKQTYQEVQEWADAMHERIYNVMNILEQQQRESDQQIQHVIMYLHTHLKNICHELKEIPKMTRVRFADGVRDIFDFTVPDWNEEEGVLRLRGHLEWMMNELDRDEYKNAYGQEDKEKIRKKVEEWLHPTQLLHVINSANEIKVRCRKVTNDKKVASSYTPWPDTENWSGGEKWSKNMTLLLGVLNYLAEKRGHLRTGKNNHRVVICDNPFGKASSDHVLGPVFHIAKQLGFQFIALTAHAEGKFLRDYFPVLYSCRLVPTKDPSINILHKEKEIHRAYFQDHAPQSLDRLGEQEQLSLLF